MTNAEHARWCITNCPALNSEMTVFWFMYGFYPTCANNKFKQFLFERMK